MTQKQLAELVGASRQTMNAIENSKHAPTVDTAIRIADVFGVSVDQLFEYRYDGKPDHSSSAPKTTTVRREISVEETIDDSAKQSIVEEKIDGSASRDSVGGKVENGLSLASLRNVF